MTFPRLDLPPMRASASGLMVPVEVDHFTRTLDRYGDELVRWGEGVELLGLNHADRLTALESRIGATAQRSSLQSLPVSTLSTILYTAETYDSDNLITPTSGVFTIPKAGLWVVSCTMAMATAAITGYLRIVAGGLNYQTQTGTFGDLGHTIIVPLNVGNTVSITVWNSSATNNLGSSVCHVYKLGN